MNKLIVIQGMPGSGKTSVCSLLHSETRVPIIEEPVEHNPFLVGFYKDPQAYAFFLQTYMATVRYQQMLTIKGELNIMDMSLWGNDVFSKTHFDKGYLSKEKWEMYQHMSDTYKSLVKTPDLMIYLDVPVDLAVARIHERDREAESLAELDFWELLHLNYEKWYEHYDDGKKVRIDASRDLMDVSLEVAEAIYEILDN